MTENKQCLKTLLDSYMLKGFEGTAATLCKICAKRWLCNRADVATCVTTEEVCIFRHHPLRLGISF